jgi:hypothetical protein
MFFDSPQVVAIFPGAEKSDALVPVYVFSVLPANIKPD